MSGVQDLTTAQLEEHCVLRVPDVLGARLQSALSGKGVAETVRIKDDPAAQGETRLLIFQLGTDEYFATLRDLPTIVETHKTKNSYVYYKSAEISQVLQVHDARVGKVSLHYENNSSSTHLLKT